MNEEEVLVGRIQDLAEQCYHRDVPSHTEFLTLAEQDLFYRTVNKIPGVRYVLSGGYEAAERKAALFLPSYAEDGDASMLPIAVVRISPLNEKFADALSHRDFLGSLMNLGVERYKLGDILIDGNQAYLICMADMADYICAEPKTERKEGSVASVRLDAVLSLAFSSSRSKMVPLIEGSQVFINGKLVTSPSASLKEDDLVTVRHMGKFRYVGVQNQTKKGRLYVAVERFVS